MVAADERGNVDQINATAPVTNGVAALVPLRVTGWPSISRLVIRSPGALSPDLPIDLPRLE
jgi:hypothetical protein